MAYGEMNVGDLRKVIEGMPDDAPLLIKPSDQKDWTSCDRHRVRDGDSVVTIEARPAAVWNYTPRMVHNIYTCNDDHFNQSQCLMIEIVDNYPA